MVQLKQLSMNAQQVAGIQQEHSLVCSLLSTEEGTI